MTPIFAMVVDPWILAFSSITVIVTVWMGFRSAKTSKTASDFFVAGRSVSVGWNASAISGEYLSAASFMGVAGMVMSSGYDALWYPVCYACGYLFLLLFIAGPLRRFGAYTIPDFAEGRFDSPLFRKIAVCFVLFIGFFYTMPQMKGAGTTLAYIFPGLPYWAGVVLVGAVITLNVALGGMKGITLVQAVQYWAKMFAISVPIFVLMAVYGHYGNQLSAVGPEPPSAPASTNIPADRPLTETELKHNEAVDKAVAWKVFEARKPLPEKAPADATWLSPFGPLTTKAAKAAKPKLIHKGPLEVLKANLPEGLAPRFTRAAREVVGGQKKQLVFTSPIRFTNALELVGFHAQMMVEADQLNLAEGLELRFSPKLRETPIDWTLPDAAPNQPLSAGGHGPREYENLTRSALEAAGITVRRDGAGLFTAFLSKEAVLETVNVRGYSLLYTYSLIIALVCGTAGLPHILVRFYTNPDGVAAKRTTMWVMILIGVFYVFPPVFGVMGRNLFPELYNGIGAKGTDKIVLELPRLLNDKYAPLGSILSGITCAGAFAAFMSTFSGLLVSMTGALAHDVYGRMLRPKSTPEQRMRAFKICAVVVGAGSMLLGFLVEGFEINKMVGWAFAIAAASYFPLLFMSVWWRGMTMRGAAAGMLTGGTLSLITVISTMVADQMPVAKPLAEFYAHHPLLRILCEQPAIWAVPLALGLMIVISKLTRKDVPTDIRMKMLVLHAPEKLGLKQEYIQEHQHGH